MRLQLTVGEVVYLPYVPMVLGVVIDVLPGEPAAYVVRWSDGERTHRQLKSLNILIDDHRKKLDGHLLRRARALETLYPKT